MCCVGQSGWCYVVFVFFFFLVLLVWVCCRLVVEFVVDSDSYVGCGLYGGRVYYLFLFDCRYRVVVFVVGDFFDFIFCGVVGLFLFWRDSGERIDFWCVVGLCSVMDDYCVVGVKMWGIGWCMMYCLVDSFREMVLCC